MTYLPLENRYDAMRYNRCGRSGLVLPAISLCLWHNFCGVDTLENSRAMLRRAFDLGITHFDLANNYGPPPGSAEETFGKLMAQDFRPYRDELVISTKAGYWMWNGPYCEWGSRKYLLEYVDIFYSHRPDPNTPIEETMGALDSAVRSGKALYAGLSNYSAEQTREALGVLRRLGTPCLIHQPKYSMFVRTPEEGLLDLLGNEGIGCIPFSPLAQGLLTSKYLKGIPENSRAAKSHGFLQPSEITAERLRIIAGLNQIALRRGQSLAQMALAWLLKDSRVTTVLVGASSPEQLSDNLQCLRNMRFSASDLQEIETLLASDR